MKKNPRSRAKNLLFENTAYINDADRDYGLIRVTKEKAHTPYPKIYENIDMDLLLARLNAEKQKRLLKQRSDQQIADKLISNKSKILEKKQTCLTPQPSILSYLAYEKVSPLAKKRITISQSVPKVHDYEPEECHFCEKKKTELNVDQLDPADSYTAIVQQSSFVLLKDSPSSDLSFYKRRKEFDMAEFSIAKNGKKMSEFQMDASIHQEYEIEDKTEWVGYDEQAQDAIDKYIKKLGVFKYDAKQITGFARTQSDEDVLTYFESPNIKSTS